MAGSLKRKKAQKAKDFVKPKLKVGKTAAKPSNHTDTLFKAKRITLNQLIGKKLSSEQDLIHQLSLTKHHSDSTRKEVLQNLEVLLPDNPSLYKQILASVTPLILDPDVLKPLIALLTTAARKQPGLMDLHMRLVVLFVLLAMSHINPRVRNNSSKFLEILIDHAPRLLTKQNFVKVLKNYFGLMAWTLVDDKTQQGLAITASSAQGGSVKKARIPHLQVLQKFLRLLLFEVTSDKDIDWNVVVTIHPQLFRYMIPQAPQPYAPLKLFVQELQLTQSDLSLSDIDLILAEDLDTRRRVFSEVFLEPMKRGLAPMIKEGGEVGREANNLLLCILEFEQDYKNDN